MARKTCYRPPRDTVFVAAHLDGFEQYLRDAGYAQVTVRYYLVSARRLGRWAAERGLTLRDLDDGAIASHRRGRKQQTRGVQALLVYLRSEGVVPPESDRSQPEPQLLEGFRHWMLQHRGVVASTLDVYRPIVRDLLQCLGNEPTHWNAQRVRRFVLQRAARSSSETVVTATRVFLRYVAAAGQVEPGLDHAVPSIAAWRLSALPRYISASQVSQVIDCCNVSTPAGTRDRAILLLLSRLALRAGDVAVLRFDDIDWKDGSLRVAGKGRRQARLPMPQEVGDAILGYLEHGRPHLDDGHVFLAVGVPLRSLRPQAVSSLVARAIQRAGVDAPSRGAHVLRHSAATHMLRQGSSLDTIATLLRHRSIETTAHYAKVDMSLLREILQPWPGVTPC